jgi:hypothetical protein
MTTAIIVLLLVAGIVALSIVRPTRLPNPGLPAAWEDRDRARRLEELRALPGARADLRVP